MELKTTPARSGTSPDDGVVTELVDSATQTDVTLKPSALVSFVSAGGPSSLSPGRHGQKHSDFFDPIPSMERRIRIDQLSVMTPVKGQMPHSARSMAQPKSPFVPIGSTVTPPEAAGYKTPTKRTTTKSKEPALTSSTLHTLSPLVQPRHTHGPKLPDFNEQSHQNAKWSVSGTVNHPAPFPPASFVPVDSAPWRHRAAPTWHVHDLYPNPVSWVPMPVSPALTNLISLYRRRVEQRTTAAAYPIF